MSNNWLIIYRNFCDKHLSGGEPEWERFAREDTCALMMLNDHLKPKEAQDLMELIAPSLAETLRAGAK